MFELSTETLLALIALLLVANLGCLALLCRVMIDSARDADVQRSLAQHAVDALNGLRSDALSTKDMLRRTVDLQEQSTGLLARALPPQRAFDESDQPATRAEQPAPPGYIDRTAELLTPSPPSSP